MTTPTAAPVAAERLAYDDPSTPAEMHADCRAAQSALTGPLTATAARLGQEQPKRDLEIPEVAARLAAAIYGDA